MFVRLSLQQSKFPFPKQTLDGSGEKDAWYSLLRDRHKPVLSENLGSHKVNPYGESEIHRS